MTFPNSDFHHQLVNENALRAIKSHGIDEAYLDQMDEQTREMRMQKHTGIELTGPELAVIKKIVFDEIRKTNDEIYKLEQSINDHTAPNTSTAEEDLKIKKQYVGLLRNNLAEKLFNKNTPETVH